MRDGVIVAVVVLVVGTIAAAVLGWEAAWPFILPLGLLLVGFGGAVLLGISVWHEDRARARRRREQ